MSFRPTYSVTTSHRPMAMTAWAASFVLPDTPSDRFLRTLARSSASPSPAVASAVANTAMLMAR